MPSLEALFCPVDDFCQKFEPKWQSELLGTGLKNGKRSQGLCLSEKNDSINCISSTPLSKLQAFLLGPRVCLLA